MVDVLIIRAIISVYEKERKSDGNRKKMPEIADPNHRIAFLPHYTSADDNVRDRLWPFLLCSFSAHFDTSNN